MDDRAPKKWPSDQFQDLQDQSLLILPCVYYFLLTNELLNNLACGGYATFYIWVSFAVYLLINVKTQGPRMFLSAKGAFLPSSKDDLLICLLVKSYSTTIPNVLVVCLSQCIRLETNTTPRHDIQRKQIIY
jgi:hypothetical protein